jgi:uncharacterized protein DUF3298
MRPICVPSIYGVLTCAVVLAAATFAQENAAVQTKMQTFTKDLPGCHTKPSPSQCASIHLVYPEIVSAPTPKAQSAIEGEIGDLILSPIEKGKPPATPDAFASQIIAHYQDWLHRGGDPKIPWAVSRSLDVVYNSRNVLCLRYTQKVELGNSHPAKSTVYLNFRPKDGKLLEVPDFIEESRLDQFTEAARRRYAQQAAPARSTDSPNEEESGEEFTLPKNFGIEADGIHFRYDDEQVDPKSHRTPEFLVPYSQVRPYLKPDVQLP